MSLKKHGKSCKEIFNIKAENIRMAFKSKSLKKSLRKIQIKTVIMKVLSWIDYNPALAVTSSFELKSDSRIL